MSTTPCGQYLEMQRQVAEKAMMAQVQRLPKVTDRYACLPMAVWMTIKTEASHRPETTCPTERQRAPRA